jgi:hypothetical protein
MNTNNIKCQNKMVVEQERGEKSSGERERGSKFRHPALCRHRYISSSHSSSSNSCLGEHTTTTYLPKEPYIQAADAVRDVSPQIMPTLPQ